MNPVKEEVEFSKISPSKDDGQWGKLMRQKIRKYRQILSLCDNPGIITHPDPEHPGVEQLSVYVLWSGFERSLSLL